MKFYANSAMMLKWFFVLCFVIINVPMVIEAKVCGEIDIRNDPNEFEQKLRNCTVIAGSLSIVLMEKHRDKNFSEYQFPELKEITGYLLLFRVYGLKSLEHLFPNLAVIRGEKLVTHYAFVLFEMMDLIEIGLKSLVKIQRGYVFISNCPMLCYANTINWSLLTQLQISGGWGNFLRFESKLCPTTTSCPTTCVPNHCWTNKHCQLLDSGYSNTDKSLKCHEECLGGCINSTPSGCNVCRNAIDNGVCVKQCPKNKFLYINMCVDANFCIHKDKRPFDGECRDNCPANYSDKDPTTGIVSNTTCYKCVQRCLRECPPSEINTLAISDQLRGCQIILGDVNIRIQSGVIDTMQILERNLGDIEEITGLLNVYRSPALTSLSFLRSLNTIRGNRLEAGKYSLIITSNENLQTLWDFREKKVLKLVRGNMLVHFNSKLCLKEIHELQQIVKTNSSDDLISSESNGYEETCTARDISSSVSVLSHSSVQIEWQRLEIPDTQKIIGYMIYYIVAPDRNITHLGIDSCSQYGWQTVFIQNFTNDANSTSYTAILTDLTQYTQYAYYVKTQVVSKNHEEDVLNVSQGQSNIIYFVTLPDVPTCPIVETFAKTNTTISINWHPAVAEKEQIDFYKVDIFKQPDEHDVLDMRNFCLYPKVDVPVSVGIEVNENQSTIAGSCTKELEDWKEDHPDSEDAEHEWRLHRKAMCAEQDLRRRKGDRRMEVMKYLENRESYGCPLDDKQCLNEYEDDETYRFTRKIHDMITVNDIGNENRPKVKGDAYRSPNFVRTMVFDKFQYNATITDLLPYTLYTMHFFSCNSISCSSYFMHNERTDSSPFADAMVFKVINDSSNPNTVHLDFSEPATPNGLTVAFQIEKYDMANLNITTICITRKQHFEHGNRYTFNNLQQGLYGFRIRSISLAMNGFYTEPEFVHVYNQTHTILDILGVLVSCIVVLVLIAAITTYFWRRMNVRRRIGSINASTQNILMMQMDDVSGSTPQEEEAPSFYHRHNEEVF